MYSKEAIQIKQIVGDASHIVVVQADNPDGDSLGSALAMESLLSEMGKQVSLYCNVETPGYLRYLRGWDRISSVLPKDFDASIIVDASTMTLFEKLQKSGDQSRLAAKPCIVLDHHETVENVVPFATIMVNDSSRASAGELIYLISEELDWKLPIEAQTFLMTSILGDTQGLTNQLTGAETYRIMGAMVQAGVDRPALEELRREYGKMPTAIFRYKAKLITQTEMTDDGVMAWVRVPQSDINTYSPLYNPAPLIQGDMLQTSGVKVAIVFKTYDDGRITGAIRCNPGSPVAAGLAEHLGGGGHAFAAGFKDTSGKSFNELKSDCIAYGLKLLAKLEEDNPDETIQYAYSTD